MRLLGSSLYKDDPDLEPLLPNFERIGHLTDGYSRGEVSADPFETIGKMLSKKDGPDIGVINLGNWDTHDNQKPRLAREFANLDQGLGTLKKSMDKVWNDTVFVIVSEFGRSVHENGTNGSDHGTGGVCMIGGGAVKGGKSLGDWPGLEEPDLFEGRDVLPAYDVRSIFAAAARDHLGLNEAFIEDQLFPEIPETYKGLDLIRQRRKIFGFV
ncbi:MAG: DUF1501 domain-containing protein [Hellea sp.]|nr:DUF1501 domain-containing protein [Hellea sp.]